MASFTIFPYPIANACTDFKVDCSDYNSILIHTILSLGSSNGVTSLQIQRQLASICPEVNWTFSELEDKLTLALRRGILITVYQNSNVDEYSQLYAVNAGMVRINPSNRKYFCISQLYRS